MMSMGEGVANVLGFHSNTLYTIHGDDHELASNISSTPINENLVNILDCLCLIMAVIKEYIILYIDP